MDSSGVAPDFFNCRIMLDGRDVPGTQRDAFVHDDRSGDHTRNHEENCSTDGIALVDAGTHSVAFNVEERNSAVFDAGSLWVLWVGFDGQGLKPTESRTVTLDASTEEGPAGHIQAGWGEIP